MSWWGKVFGGTFGYMLGGPLGALLGAALGHKFDKGLDGFARGQAPWGDQERIQTVFFTATFTVMGHIAKADGKVSRDEIAFAEAVMSQMSLPPEQRKLAIELFNEGKSADFDLEEVIEQFRRECHRRNTLMRMFLEIQLQAALADGKLDTAERQLLQRIFSQLGFPQQEFEHLLALVMAARNYASGDWERATGSQRVGVLKQAYGVLGVTESATDTEVKKAYRRLMSQHHPDKLVAKGLPEEMMKIATEKAQEIRAAYDLIKQARGMR